MDVWVLISLLCAFLVGIFVILFVGMLILPVATSSPGHFTEIVLGLAVLNIMGNTFLWNLSLLIIWRTLIDAITEEYENCLQNAEKKMIKAMKKMFIERWMSMIFFNSWQMLSKRMADTTTLSRIISYQMERNKALQKRCEKAEIEIQRYKKLLSILHGELECSICFGLMEDPHILPSCRHRFCKKCIVGAIDVNGHTCPLCRTQIGPKRDDLAKIITESILCKVAVHG
ncbi:hypothetical protein CTEN210_01313 [Chaetoceros tenuissimus]|uniref:RING-type E3 ubiquitin transferase n=1 Tax=Chaetoceros tenuissimus TaxID=426638 RepID=A0AAD3GZZ0_9STRA|nr:hypothetical protein CTEN210_01313 [Chaetoceros tenuissimus]